MKESSRLIVKNLPKSMDDKRLKHFFESKGYVITDCHVMTTKQGASRMFAFLGLKNETIASEILNKFNNTFIESSKVTIEYAQPKESTDINRAWSRHTAGSSAYERSNPEGLKETLKVESKNKKEKNEKIIDEKLDEFLGVMTKRKGDRVWANSEVANGEETFQRDNQHAAEIGRMKAKDAKDKKKVEKDENSDDENIVFSDDDEDIDNENDVVLGDDDEEMIGMKQLKAASNNKNNQQKEEEDPMAWLRKKSQSIPINNDDEKEEDEEESDTGNHSEDPTPSSSKAENLMDDGVSPEALAGETGRLRILNLAYSCKEVELENFLKLKFGPVESVHLVRHEITQEPRGFAFIQFLFAEHAVKALATSKQNFGIVFQGRKISMEAAVEKKSPSEMAASQMGDQTVKAVGGIPLKEKRDASSSYKRELEKKLKQKAGNVRTWNLLYVSANGVADAIASQLGVDKSDLLDLDSEGLAVRVALGEAQLIRETKLWLQNEGIRVDAFERCGSSLKASEFEEKEKKKGRSKTVMILKHLPPKVTDEDLRGILSPCGSYQRLCIAPSRTIAVVQFAEENRATAAFQRLAFRKFLGVPLLVEWAPIDVFTSNGVESTNLPAPSSAAATERTTTVTADSQKKVNEGINVEEETEDNEGLVSLFVKNLNFRTSDSAFKSFFSKQVGFKNAKLMVKAAPAGSDLPVDVLSMGYGFIEFDSVFDAKECMKRLQGAVLDGHSLEISIAANRSASIASIKAKDNSKEKSSGAGASAASLETARVGTRLLVKNLAFQATKRDVTKLFTPYGQLASVRLPKKPDGTCRGFGFVEFASRTEAKNALEMLQHAHLYGRHLVIEPAKEDDPSDNAEDAQKRATEQLEKSAGGGEIGESRKRRRLAKLDETESKSMDAMMDL